MGVRSSWRRRVALGYQACSKYGRLTISKRPYCSVPLWFVTICARCVMRALCLILLYVLSPSVARPGMLAGQRPASADATEALTCIQRALGGTAAFAAVSSLYIVGTTRPLQDSGMRPVPGAREISVVFPDRYRRADRGQPLKAGEGGMSSTVGFDRDMILSNPRHWEPKRAEVSARQDFARQMLMRLPRTSSGVRLSQHVVTDSGRERLAVEAFGPDGYRATLLADRGSCEPIALQFVVVTGTVKNAWRVDLSEYRAFGGIKFPTLLRESIDGLPSREERVTSVEVNTPTAAKGFAARR